MLSIGPTIRIGTDSSVMARDVHGTGCPAWFRSSVPLEPDWTAHRGAARGMVLAPFLGGDPVPTRTRGIRPRGEVALFAFLWCWWSCFGVARAADEPAVDEVVDEVVEEGAEPEIVYPVPERVAVGVHVNDVQNIDWKTHSYAVDFYVWFRWKNPDFDPSASMEFTNPIELWGLMVTPIYEEAEEFEDGTLYQVLRVQGTFSRKMPLYDYPFDEQVLLVSFEDAASDVSALVYEADAGSPTVNAAMTLPGFVVGAPTFDVGSVTYPTAFGDPRTVGTPSYARATIAIPIGRPPLAYITKLLLPVFCVVGCAALMFLLSPSLADARVDVGITSLLTVVALQITSNDGLPEVGYLVLLDKVYLLAYGFVITGLGVVVWTTSLHERGETERARHLHRTALLVTAGAWLAGMIALVVPALR